MRQGQIAVAAAFAFAAAVMGQAEAALVTIPQSALTPTAQLYTDQIGGGIGSVVVMTGGGNANGAGDPSGRNDDGFSGPINLGFSLPFFGASYTQFWANNNGNISFTGGNEDYIPTGPIGASIPTIAIWFGDVDSRGAASGVLHMRQDITDELILTWDRVGYFNIHDDKLNTFQMVVRGPGYSIPAGEGAIGFFWLGMPWEVTDTSQTAAIGFGDGAGNGEVLQGSNAAGLNNVVAFHQIWFDPNLQPICGVPGTPPCESSVPEPGSLALLGLGVAGLAAFRRRRAAS